MKERTRQRILESVRASHSISHIEYWHRVVTGKTYRGESGPVLFGAVRALLGTTLGGRCQWVRHGEEELLVIW